MADEAALLKKKVSIRKGYREVIEKRLKETDDLLAAPGEVDPVKVTRLKISISEKHVVLKKLDEEIIDLVKDDAELVREITESDEFNERIYEGLARINTYSDNKSETASVPEATSTSVSKARLPDLNLPIFKGDITEWTSFWDMYNVSVHTNSSLSPIQKFTYLRTLLSQAASAAVAGLTLSEANYDEAIKILHDRFGNQEKIIAKHMEELLHLDSSNYHNLRALYDKVECHTRELKALGVSEEAYNYLLPSLIVKKLPRDLALSISRRIPEDAWNLSSIMKELGEELRARERTVDKTGNNDPKNREYYKRSEDRRHRENGAKRPPGPPTTTAMTSHTSSSRCCYCMGQHAADMCSKICKPEERRQALRDTGRCFICLKQGHLSRTCRSSGRCGQCNGRHHSSICFKASKEEKPASTNSVPLDPSAAPFKSASLLADDKGSILLQTAQALVHSPDKTKCMNLNIIFDNGSQRSYITERAKERLKLSSVGQRELFISTFAASKSRKQICNIVKAILELASGEELLLSLLTTSIICEPIICQWSNEKAQQYQHLHNIELAEPAREGELIEFDILIGLDHYWDIITGETIRGPSGPTAIYSKIGWILSGPTMSDHTPGVTHTFLTGVRAIEDKLRLDEQLRSFWELESLGISDQELTLYDQFKDHIKFDGKRYEVVLPWRDHATLLPDNYDLSLSRLKGLLRRMRQDPDLLQEYDKSIKDQIENDIIEVVEDPDLVEGERVHYLPHHAVVRRDKQTTKLRVVFDASAKSSGPSLNDCLHVGSKFNQRILEILVRFRCHNNGFIADVEKAFLMVQVHVRDRDVLRFLWVTDPFQDPLNLKVLRFKRVTFGVTASPFLLNATLRYHIEGFKEDNPILADKLLRSIYVDDVISGTSSKEESFETFQCFHNMLATGGFNLRKYVYSGMNPEVGGESHKVLGVSWMIKEDEILIDLRSIADGANIHNPTKRHILSIVSKIYDPIGFVSPVTICFKSLLQGLHCAKVGWDEDISGHFLDCWTELISSICNSEPVTIRRCYFREIDASRQCRLVGFCDSSVKAYAAVVYLQSNDSDQKMSFVVSKTRVAPIKQQTIPRLELLGALLLARLISCVYEALKMEINLSPSVCYTDSRVALYWIKGERREWKPFVYNRVKEIRERVPSSHWRHCPGKYNPADIPSRGTMVRELIHKMIWWNSPEELDNYLDDDDQVPEECLTELRASEKRECGLLISEVEGVSSIMNIQRYSSYLRLISVTAYVLKFIGLMKLKLKDSNGLLSTDLGVLRDKAEILWVKETQKQLVADKGFKQWSAQLQLFVDKDGVWRCGGRLSNADLPYHTKHPIILPGKNHFSVLCVLRAHSRVFHNGVKETLNELRAQYWVLRARALVRRLIHQCVLCRKLEGQAYAVPRMPPLPPLRVTEQPPFSYTGIDFAGPLFVKNSEYEVGGKVWLCLYTCCVTRAIHLDVLHNMSFEFFYRSFKRFIARRGLPRRVLSDNAKTFKRAARLLREIMEHKDSRYYLAEYKIQWSFNIEKSPWWGGVFERLIRSVKRCLKKIVGRSRLTHEELLTVITEVEMIINSRPLSYITQDDLEEPITPSHLLIGRRLISLPEHLCCDEEEEFSVTPQLLSRRMSFISRTIGQFWIRWKKEYLLELREAHRLTFRQSPMREQIHIGDVVVVHSDDKRRGFWNTGRIEEVIPGRDGEIRAAVVRVYTGQKNTKLLNRPIQKLYPIEVSRDPPTQSPLEESNCNLSPEETEDLGDVCEQPSEEEGPTARSTVPEDPPSRRSKRSAAVSARDMIKIQSLL